MIDFRIQGFDIMPDIVGYILFAMGCSMLVEYSRYFKIAGNFSFLMILVSIFTLYERPVEDIGIQFNAFGFIALILALVVIYHLFKGIQEMAKNQMQPKMEAEADERWKQFLYLQLAAFLAFVIMFFPILIIPYLLILFVLSIVLMVKIMGFMRRCGETLK